MKHTVARYATAVVLSAIALVLTAQLSEFLAPMRLVFLWGAVLLTALLAGFGPAVLAIVLSLTGAMLLVYQTPVDALRLGVWAVFAGGIGIVAARLRHAEQRMRRSERRYRTLVEATPLPQAVWTATADGGIQWSDAWTAITGQTREELDAGNGMNVVHPEDAARTWERWRAALAQETFYEDEIRVLMKSGRYRWFAIKAVPVPDGGGEWIGIVADIHDRKRHEENASFINRASEVLASSLDQTVTLRTLARLCVPSLADWCSVHFAHEGSYERVVVEHSDPARVQFVEKLDRSMRPSPERDPIAQVIHTGKTQLAEDVSPEALEAIVDTSEQVAVLRTLGFRSWIIAPMTTGGRTIGALTLVHGESGRHFSSDDVPLVEELARRAATAVDNARLYEAAEAANRAKDEFLATLSHELRTPLTAIAGWAHMLSLGVTDEATTRIAIETIQRSAQAQGELIDDLLDLSRVVAGTLHLNVVDVDLSRVVHETVVAAKPAADAKGLTLEVEGTSMLPVRGDERRLRQIVWNLVTNAVKFTDEGSVRIELSTRGGNARVTIVDTGRGIDASFLPYVFDRFRQADSTTSRQHGGLGLGLAVVRHLVELHGGTVHAESGGRGTGATFTFELPLARRVEVGATSRWPADADASALRGRKLLVVDDDADARLVLASMLRNYGAEVTTAASASEGLELLANDAYDGVVSDIAMPSVDGYELVRRIRAIRNIPVIAVSAIATGPDDRTRALEAGFTGFVRKPVVPEELARAVLQS